MNKINYTIVQMSDGSILVGNIINGKAEGHGWLISEPKYEGEFKNNLKHGSGRLFYADGLVVLITGGGVYAAGVHGFNVKELIVLAFIGSQTTLQISPSLLSP